MEHVFGLTSHLNPIVWLTNFGIYKAHLQACSGAIELPISVVQSVFYTYSVLFVVLSDFDFT